MQARATAATVAAMSLVISMAICMLSTLAPAVEAWSQVQLNKSLARDFNLSWAKPRWYNPSIVEYGEDYISSAKMTTFFPQGAKIWWVNHVFMCRGKRHDDIRDLQCDTLTPWKGATEEFKECEFGSGVRGGRTDVDGLGDVKVWVWPGRGVYAIFGRKPQRQNNKRTCKGHIIYHQYIYQIVAEAGATALQGDSWRLDGPIQLLPPSDHAYPSSKKYVMEKNWMPFVYTDPKGTERLYCTYMVQPHIVFEIFPDGSTQQKHTTHNATLMLPFANYSIHGGPPVVYVPANLSSDGTPYYLGIMHHIEMLGGRQYRHFAFKFKPQPPFNITAVSDELPLVFNQRQARTAWVIFVNGLFMNPSGTVYISYGAADAESRVLVLPIAELDRLFTSNIVFNRQ